MSAKVEKSPKEIAVLVCETVNGQMYDLTQALGEEPTPADIADVLCDTCHWTAPTGALIAYRRIYFEALAAEAKMTFCAKTAKIILNQI